MRGSTELFTRTYPVPYVSLSLSSANKCLLKVGHYSAQLEQYPKAIEIYEQVCMCLLCMHLLDFVLAPFSPQIRGIQLLVVTVLSHRYNSRIGVVASSFFTPNW